MANLKYTKEEFQNKVSEYFNLDVSLKNFGSLHTKSGLLLSLDISRETWREYKEREEFVDTIKRAELIIETEWLSRLEGNSPTGAIFYLKNAFKEEYRDRHETDVTSGGKPFPTPLLNIKDVLQDNSSKEDSEVK